MAAHPRACSTAFERVFMTQHETIRCFHEPFGDAFYYGPERLSPRFSDEQARINSGFSESTYGSVLERIKQEASEVRPFHLRDPPPYIHAEDHDDKLSIAFWHPSYARPGPGVTGSLLTRRYTGKASLHKGY